MTRKLLPFSTMLLVVVTTAVCHYMHKTLVSGHRLSTERAEALASG